MPRKRTEPTGESPQVEAEAVSGVAEAAEPEEPEGAPEAPESPEAELVDDDVAALLEQKAELEDEISKLQAYRAEQRKRRGKICMLLYMMTGNWEKSVCIEGTCGWWVSLENSPDGGACTWKLLPVVLGDRE